MVFRSRRGTGRSSLGRRRWHGTHCPRRLLLRDETSQPGRGTEKYQERKRRQSEEKREREKERGSQTAVKQAQTQASFSPRSFPSASLRSSRVRATVCASSSLSFVAFLRALSLAQPGDRAESKPPYVPGRGPPGSRSVASRPLPSSLFSSTTILSSSSLSFSSIFSFPFRSVSLSPTFSTASPRRCREIATRHRLSGSGAHVDLRSSPGRRVFVRWLEVSRLNRWQNCWKFSRVVVFFLGPRKFMFQGRRREEDSREILGRSLGLNYGD